MIDFDSVARQIAQEIQQLEAQQQQVQITLIGLRAQLDLVAQLRTMQQAAPPAAPTPVEP